MSIWSDTFISQGRDALTFEELRERVIKKRIAEKEAKRQAAKVVSEKEVRKALHRDILQQSRFHTTSSSYGQLR